MQIRKGKHGDFYFCPNQYKGCSQKTITKHEQASGFMSQVYAGLREREQSKGTKRERSYVGCSRCDWVQTGTRIGDDYCPNCGQPKRAYNDN